MVRSVLAVIAGFLVMTVLVIVTTIVAVRLLQPAAGKSGGGVQHLSRPYLTANLAASAAAAVLGGWVAGAIARHDPVIHGLVLAGVMVAMSLVSIRQAGASQPRWYQLALLLVMPVLAVGGSALVR